MTYRVKEMWLSLSNRKKKKSASDFSGLKTQESKAMKSNPSKTNSPLLVPFSNHVIPSHLESIFSSQLGVTSPIVCSNGAGFSVRLSRLLFCRLKAIGRISAKKNTDI
jgi:hypothetical protein